LTEKSEFLLSLLRVRSIWRTETSPLSLRDLNTVQNMVLKFLRRLFLWILVRANTSAEAGEACPYLPYSSTLRHVPVSSKTGEACMSASRVLQDRDRVPSTICSPRSGTVRPLSRVTLLI